MDDLADVAQALYALPPEDFTAARDAAAKQADGELRKAVKALRRPTASAALVNRLAREQPDLFEQLLALGPALAAAQAGRSGDEMRELDRQRRELVTAVTASAAGGATAAVRAEVEQTLVAALADPAAADAVRTGTLVRALAFAGFGGVDVEGAVAVVPTASRRKPEPAATNGGAGVTRAEREALDAAAALDDAVRAAESADRRQEDAERDRQEAEAVRETAQREADELEERLTAMRERLADAGHRAHDAARAAEQAAQAAERARTRVAEVQEAAEQARAALDTLRRGT